MRQKPSPVPRYPHTYPCRILLAVIGLTPQVLTETLYALAVRPAQGQEPFVPTRIQVITTGEGCERARLMLLDSQEGRYHQFCQEYGLEHRAIAFDEASFHVIERNGYPLSDITTEADNTSVADTLNAMVRHFTAEDDTVVHASIAGGRKTMGFYLAYSLSLYGRPQDRLSHVLVNEPFSSSQEFFYPPARPKRLVIRNRSVNTRDARIMLADIPFLRLRDGLPQRLIDGQASFSETVAAAQLALEPPMLVIDYTRQNLVAGGETVRLSTADFAFYALLARRCANRDSFIEWRTKGIAEAYLQEYRHTAGNLSGHFKRVEQRLVKGAEKVWVDERKAKVNRAIRDQLGESLGRIYAIASEGVRPDTRYGLRIKPRNITFLANTTNRDSNPGI